MVCAGSACARGQGRCPMPHLVGDCLHASGHCSLHGGLRWSSFSPSTSRNTFGDLEGGRERQQIPQTSRTLVLPQPT